MTDNTLTDYTPIDFQYHELVLPYQEIEFTPEPVELDFKPMKVDWLEAKSLYLTDHKLSYRDIAYRSSRSRNGAHGTVGQQVAKRCPI
jgi:hypothetical protein